MTHSDLKETKTTVLRGGLGMSTYEPHHFINFVGENCREVCGKIWDKHNPFASPLPLKYARCYTRSLANSEEVSNLTHSNAEGSYADFINDCDSMQIRIITDNGYLNLHEFYRNLLFSYFAFSQAVVFWARLPTCRPISLNKGLAFICLFYTIKKNIHRRSPI